MTIAPNIPAMPTLTLPFDRVAEYLESAEWTFAKTMPKNPHFWTHIKTWPGSQEDWDGIIRHIREEGEDRHHWGKVYRCLYLNGWRYWTMAKGKRHDEFTDCTLINRAEMTDIEATPYDRIAPHYEDLFRADKDHDEELALVQSIAPSGKVLDIGCGTGWLTEHLHQDHEYLGIDSSSAMLERFNTKHQQIDPKLPFAFPIRHQWIKFEHFWEKGGFDTIVALFGVASYLQPEAVERAYDMLRPEGRMFFMYYDHDYKPVTHSATGIYPKRYPTPDGLPLALNCYRMFERAKL